MVELIGNTIPNPTALLIQRYNEEGPNGLLDKRKCNRSDKLLNHELMQELEKALESGRLMSCMAFLLHFFDST